MKTNVKLNNLSFIKDFQEYSVTNNVRKDFVVKFDFPNRFEHSVFGVGENAIYLTLIAKRTKDVDARAVMREICSIADKNSVNTYLEVMPVYIFTFKDDVDEVPARCYAAQLKLKTYYEQFGFQILDSTGKLKSGYANIYMVRMSGALVGI